MNFEVKILNPHIKYFETYMQKATVGSAGVDLRAALEDASGVCIHPGETVLISTGLAVWIKNPNYAGLIMARSGLASKEGLAPANKVGLIDSDYQGPLMVALHNHSKESRVVHAWDRIAQLVVVPVVNAKYEVVEQFSNETVRGEGGFGSTG